MALPFLRKSYFFKNKSNIYMNTADWKPITDPKALLVGETSMLQWKDEVMPYAMFLDYYFRDAPYDLGERSRWSDAKALINLVYEITGGKCRPESLYGTLLTNEIIPRPPKGKHILVPEEAAKRGVEHIKELLEQNSSIETIVVIGMQSNYYMQKFGLYDCGEELTQQFLKGAEPRRVGLADKSYPFYQPVNAKPFREVCFKRYVAKDFPGVEIVPILPINSYPLMGSELQHFGDSFDALF